MKRLLALVLAGIVLAALLAFVGGATTTDTGMNTDLVTLEQGPDVLAPAAHTAAEQAEPADSAEHRALDGDTVVLLCFTDPASRTNVGPDYLLNEDTAYNGRRELLIWAGDQSGPRHRWLRG